MIMESYIAVAAARDEAELNRTRDSLESAGLPVMVEYAGAASKDDPAYKILIPSYGRGRALCLLGEKACWL